MPRQSTHANSPPKSISTEKSQKPIPFPRNNHLRHAQMPVDDFRCHAQSRKSPTHRQLMGLERTKLLLVISHKGHRFSPVAANQDGEDGQRLNRNEKHDSHSSHFKSHRTSHRSWRRWRQPHASARVDEGLNLSRTFDHILHNSRRTAAHRSGPADGRGGRSW